MTDQIAPPPPRSRLLTWLPLALGTVLALLVLGYLAANVAIKLADAGFGAETAGFLQTGVKTQCADATDSDDCLASWRKAGAPPAAIWFGNSQLYGINRYRAGDLNAPELLRRAMAARGSYLVTYSQPNANLTEEAIVWNTIQPAYKPKLLILPICYDDIREVGVRDTIADLTERPGVMAEMKRKSYWPRVAGPVQESFKAAAPVAVGHQSLQSRTEAAATGFLSRHWQLWADREALRGLLGFAIHTLRNQALGIHSTSKRPVDANVYRDRLALIDGLLADMRAGGTQVLLYVPPYRQDIDGPYPMEQYRAFKADLQALAKKHGTGFVDLDPIVPGPEWATVTDQVFGFHEPDFMHFTADGHKRLAAGIDGAVRRMGY